MWIVIASGLEGKSDNDLFASVICDLLFFKLRTMIKKECKSINTLRFPAGEKVRRENMYTGQIKK
jgi:hypothetical protein